MKKLYLSLFIFFLSLSSCTVIRTVEERVYQPHPIQKTSQTRPQEPSQVLREANIPEIAVVEEYVEPLPEQYDSPPPVFDRSRIQIALILDTSGSMDDLLEHAKVEFWYIVDDLMAGYEGFEAPRLEIALYEYGNQSIGRHQDYIRQVVPLTTDLDWIADELWGLRSRGDTEFDGLVIDRAVQELTWSYQPEDIKLIYIIGNETFRDGPVPPYRAIDRACMQGIEVHTLFCGSYRKGADLGWQENAYCGSYAALDFHAPIQPYVTSYDQQICELNVIYNTTFIPYGSYGASSYERCIRQDRNFASYGSSWLSVRTAVKSGPYYDNPQWDLIDAIDCGQVNLNTLPQQDWPDVLQGKNIREAELYIGEKRKERARIRAQIQQLNQQRRFKVEQMVAEQPVEHQQYSSLKQAVTGSLYQQVEKTVRQPHAYQLEKQKKAEEAKKRLELMQQQREEKALREQKLLQQQQQLEADKKREEQIRRQKEADAIRKQKLVQQQQLEADKKREEQIRRQKEADAIRKQKLVQQQQIEADKKREEQIRRQKEADALRQQQIEQQRKAEAARQRQEQARQQREAEARRQQQIEQQRKAEAARQRQEQARQQREAEARRQQQIEQQRKAEAARQRQEQARQQREAEARRQQQIEQQRKAEAARQRQEQARQQREAEVRRQQQIEQQRKAEAARQRQEQARQQREAEVRRQQQIEQQRKAAEVRKQQATQVKKKSASGIR